VETTSNGHVRSVRLPDLDQADVLSAIRDGAYTAVTEHLRSNRIRDVGVELVPFADPLAPEVGERTARVRDLEVYVAGPHRVTYAYRQGQCPRCRSRVKSQDKLVGFPRTDSPDLLVWVCKGCANKLVKS
jgi:hypothetical protein